MAANDFLYASTEYTGVPPINKTLVSAYRKIGPESIRFFFHDGTYVDWVGLGDDRDTIFGNIDTEMAAESVDLTP